MSFFGALSELLFNAVFRFSVFPLALSALVFKASFGLSVLFLGFVVGLAVRGQISLGLVVSSLIVFSLDFLGLCFVSFGCFDHRIFSGLSWPVFCRLYFRHLFSGISWPMFCRFCFRHHFPGLSRPVFCRLGFCVIIFSLGFSACVLSALLSSSFICALYVCLFSAVLL